MIESLTSGQASEIIKGLALRTKQVEGCSEYESNLTLGRQLSKQFSREFDWKTGRTGQGVFEFHLSKIKKLKVR